MSDSHGRATGSNSVAIIAGSKSDQSVVEDAAKVLDMFGVSYEVKYLSAHRNRDKLEAYVRESKAEVFIAIAGLAAHLPGFIASISVNPVIGVPVSAKLGGLDSLLAIAQMPSGVPVATVGIDNGKNAAFLSLEILSLKDEGLRRKLLEYRSSLG